MLRCYCRNGKDRGTRFTIAKGRWHGMFSSIHIVSGLQAMILSLLRSEICRLFTSVFASVTRSMQTVIASASSSSRWDGSADSPEDNLYYNLYYTIGKRRTDLLTDLSKHSSNQWTHRAAIEHSDGYYDKSSR